MKRSGVRRPASAVRAEKSPKSGARSPKARSRHLPESGLRTPDSEFRTLIIGYGNPLRSDDALGWHAARLLAEALDGQNTEIVTCQQLTPELAEPLSRCLRAVFIDADARGKPGAIHCRAVRPQLPPSSAFTHTCTPGGLLASAKQLYGKRPQAIVITVSAQSFAFGESLSPIVCAALPEVVDQVCNWLGVVRAAVL